MFRGTPTGAGQLSLSLAPEPRIYRVTDLNLALQRVLETDFQAIAVTGEISGCRLAPSGHYYFLLKDDQSQIKAVLFKSKARFSRCKPQDGLAVLARGSLDLFVQRGEYQLIVESLEPQGAGALQLAFEQLKQKLQAEGLFDPSRKRPLPRYPQRIAIVTSPSGAVIRDMLNIFERRFPGLHIRLYPVQVQGDVAASQVREALAWFNRSRWPDVILVARGGGSIEDLWAFNEEAVARAIAASAVPVVSAIGHETDFTICDFVADLRAPTPSAAAELVVCTKESLLDQNAAARARLVQSMRYRILTALRDLNRKGSERASTLIHRTITRRAQRLDDLDARLQQTDLRLRFARLRRHQETLSVRLARQMQTLLWQARRRQESVHLHLTQVSPLAILARGYSIVRDASGRVLRSADETQPGQQLSIRLARGEIDAIVSRTKPEG
jgi:exodeoxyribonuclease VII large subunit